MLLRTPSSKISFYGCGIALFVVLIIVLLVADAKAAKEVISDLDCVVEPSIRAKIGSSVPGLLEEVHYDKADFVQAGSVLAKLESGVETAALNLAQRVASYNTAIALRKMNAAFGERTVNRNQALFLRSSISSQNMDQVSTEAEIAKLQVQQERENRELSKLEALRAEAALQRRTIVSPFDGTIVKRFKTVGEYVEGEPVFEIARLDPLHVDVILPLEHLGVVTAGMTGVITLNVPDHSDKQYDASVRRIDALADAASGTYGVQLELPNPDLLIPAGVRCQIDFIAN